MTMQAMVWDGQAQGLQLREIPRPVPDDSEVLIRVESCGVCRTDLHIIDGELRDPKLPLIPGHQIVGRIVSHGSKVEHLAPGDRVGVPWLAATCQRCGYCERDQENLCGEARFTGYDRNGGFAEYVVANPQFCFRLPDDADANAIAPLLCGGLIGFRAYRKCGRGAERLGFYGFGSAAHMLTQVAVADGRSVYAFTRPGDESGQAFALQTGATWAGDSDQMPPHELDAAIIFAPVGLLVPAALRAVRRGGRVVCAGIHMSDIPSFPYADLWGERRIESVANLTRADGDAFLQRALEIPVRANVTAYPLDAANEALDDLRAGRILGSAVVQVSAKEAIDG